MATQRQIRLLRVLETMPTVVVMVPILVKLHRELLNMGEKLLRHTIFRVIKDFFTSYLIKVQPFTLPNLFMDLPKVKRVGSLTHFIPLLRLEAGFRLTLTK